MPLQSFARFEQRSLVTGHRVSHNSVGRVQHMQVLPLVV
jgi:hypothetical protein